MKILYFIYNSLLKAVVAIFYFIVGAVVSAVFMVLLGQISTKLCAGMNSRYCFFFRHYDEQSGSMDIIILISLVLFLHVPICGFSLAFLSKGNVKNCIIKFTKIALVSFFILFILAAELAHLGRFI